MVKRIRAVYERLFYDPYRSVARSKNIQMGDSKLGQSFSVSFDVPREGISLRIGNRCLLRNQFVFDAPGGSITVGDGVFINSGSMIISRSSIEIGDGVMMAWGCVVFDHDSHSLSYLDRIEDQDLMLRDFASESSVARKNWDAVRTAPIRIGNYAWLGFDAVVLKGVTIGEGAIIGARSVVTKDVPPWTVAAGNPARIIKQLPPELRKASESSKNRTDSDFDCVRQSAGD